MATRRLTKRQERIQQALEELKGVIQAKYPDVQFEITRGPEDPRQINLLAKADIEDTDEIKDLIIDREFELQVEERLPIHVIPLWPEDRAHEELRKRRQGLPNWIDGKGDTPR